MLSQYCARESDFARLSEYVFFSLSHTSKAFFL
jgi:hypothetical protein